MVQHFSTKIWNFTTFEKLNREQTCGDRHG